jgi:5-bromo-4-chloroindolyl phosphate hydrolysis protein
MILIWPLGSFIYGLFSSNKKLFKWLSVIGISSIILMLLVLSNMSNLERTELTNLSARIQSMETLELSQEDIIRLKESLVVLRDELKLSIRGWGKNSKASALLREFKVISEDNKITQSEFSEWMGAFKSRDVWTRCPLRAKSTRKLFMP